MEVCKDVIPEHTPVDGGGTVILSSHVMELVENLCDHVAVMQRGRIVEQGRPRELYQNPQDDYTKTLLSAIPIPDPRRRANPHPGGTSS